MSKFVKEMVRSGYRLGGMCECDEELVDHVLLVRNLIRRFRFDLFDNRELTTSQALVSFHKCAFYGVADKMRGPSDIKQLLFNFPGAPNDKYFWEAVLSPDNVDWLTGAYALGYSVAGASQDSRKLVPVISSRIEMLCMLIEDTVEFFKSDFHHSTNCCLTLLNNRVGVDTVDVKNGREIFVRCNLFDIIYDMADINFRVLLQYVIGIWSVEYADYVYSLLKEDLGGIMRECVDALKK